jgi:hypothetical protein
VIVTEGARGGEGADVDRVEVAEVAQVEDEPMRPNVSDGVHQQPA